jgi:pimeloyl-ACP methyl ester carboxylesterase
MPTIRVNGTSLYYEERGTGPGVIFVHGSWVDHGTWAAVVEPLASQFRVVSYDRRGHSRSERSPEQGSAEQDAADLIELIERLDLAPVFVVGNSSGALITLRAAAARPDLLRGLSIHEPPGLALLAGEPRMRPMLEGYDERISGVRVLLEDGKDAEAAEQFAETVALGPGMWKQLPPDRQATWVDNAPTFLDELRDPDGLNVDLDAWPATPSRRCSPTVIKARRCSLPCWIVSRRCFRMRSAIPTSAPVTFPTSPTPVSPRRTSPTTRRAENSPPRWLQGAVLYGPWASPGRQRAGA